MKRLMVSLAAAVALATVSIAQAQTIKYYPPIPDTDRSSVTNPPAVFPTNSNLAASCSGPQSMATARTFYNPDGTNVFSDSVTVPSNFVAAGEAFSGACLRDYADYVAANVTAEISDAGVITPTDMVFCKPGFCGDNNCLAPETAVGCPADCAFPVVPISPPYPAGGAACGDGSCIDPENNVSCPADCPAGQTPIRVPKDWHYACLYNATSGTFPETFRKCFSDCFVQDWPAFYSDHPESCKVNKNFARLTDGEQDLADAFLKDSEPAGAELVWPDGIPDPTDAFYPSHQLALEMAQPIDTIGMKTKADGLAHSVILNRLPLNPKIKDQINAMTFADLWSMVPLIGPYPLYYARADFQDKGHQFAILSDFGTGPVPPVAATNPTITYNDENESTAVEDIQWGLITGIHDCHGKIFKGAPKNTLSQAASIRALNHLGDAKEDIAILHQRFYHPRVTHMPADDDFYPNWIDYCTNVDKTTFTIPDLVPGSESPLEFYAAIDLEALGISSVISGIGIHLGLHLPIGEFSNLGYLTSFQNTNVGDALDASLFKKQPTAASPWRYCVSQFPTDMEVANTDGNTKPDVLVANYGVFDILGILAAFGVAPPGGIPLFIGPFSLNLMGAGGLTVLSDFDGQHSKLYHYPLNPTPMKSNDPVHPINVVAGDWNGDGNQEAAMTFFDGMGFNLAGQTNVLLTVPDVIAGNDVTGIGGWDINTKCNGGAAGSANCVGGGAAPPANTDAAVFTASYDFSAVSPHLTEFKCDRIEELKEDELHPARNQLPLPPAPVPACGRADCTVWGDLILAPPGDNFRDLWQCRGKALNPTCPELKADNASRFIYYVGYKGDTSDGSGQWSADNTNVATYKLPSAWDGLCTVTTVGAHDFADCNIPGFEEWKCDWRHMAGAGNTTDIKCTGISIPRSAPLSPVFPSKLPEILRIHAAAGETWYLAPVGGKVAVERDMQFECGVKFNLRRKSEFAVYMNKGDGTFYPPDHMTVGNNFVEVAFTGMNRIVPELPLKQTWGGMPATDFNRTDHRMSQSNSGAIDGKMGFGPWPYAVAAADLVDANGIPVPDGRDDLVIGMNNAHEVCIFPSQSTPTGPNKWNPFTNAKMICFNSTSQDYKKKLETFLQPVISEIAADPSGSTLDAKDYLRLFVGLASGTSFVDVPKEPLNGLDDIDGSAEKRLGITAIHSFPFKDMETIANTLLGIHPLTNFYGELDYVNGP